MTKRSSAIQKWFCEKYEKYIRDVIDITAFLQCIPVSVLCHTGISSNVTGYKNV